MRDDHNAIIAGIVNLFPDQIKVYDLSSLKNLASEDTSSLLHQHFSEPLAKEIVDKLVWQIAGFLKDKEQSAVYSFFYRSSNPNSSESEWFLSSSRLNKCDKGLPQEVVVFSYDLQLFGDIKKRLYRVLENDEFFKEHFNKVSSLTKREKEIIQLLSTGMSSPEIANAMYISVHTVNTHRKSINDKLVIKSIAGLLKFAEVFELTTSNHAI